MADFGSPVVNAQTAFNPMQSMSNVLGIKRQMQDLQTGQYQQQSAQANAQMDQQSAQQRSGIARVMAAFDPTKHVGKDGTLDLDNVLTDPALRQAAGDQFPQVIQQMIQAKQGQLTAKQQLANLNGTLRDQFSSTVGSLRTDPDVVKDDETGMGRSKVKQAMKDFAATGGPDAQRVADTYAGVIDHVPQGKIAQTLSNFQLQAMDAGAQTGRQAPNLADTGSKLQDVNPQSAGGNLSGQKPLIKDTSATILSNAAGQAVRVAPGGASASVIPTAPGPGAAANANPTSSEVLAQKVQSEGVSNRVSQALNSANNTVQAQDALSRAKAILESPDSPKTGTNFDAIKSLKNTMSSLGMDTKGADDMNTLAKNLARFEAARAVSSGLGGTDAARELSHAGTANVSLDNKALLGIIKQSLASEKAVQSYAKVQSKTNDPQMLLKNETDFRNIPHMIEAHEYGMSRNQDEANSYLQSHAISPQQMKSSRDAIKEFDSR